MNKNEENGGFFINLRKILHIMKLSVLLIFLSSALAYSSVSYSQSAKLSLDLENTSVKEVLKAIENQSEFLFFFQEQQVDLTRQVNIQVADRSIEDVLDKLFYDTNNIYTINDRQIVIGIAPVQKLEEHRPADAIEKNQTIDQQQQKQVTGRVTDNSGAPIPGVSVIVRGTTTGTVTNSNGEFSINVPMNTDELQFSFVGMRTQEVNLGSRTNVSVILEEETVGIDEVVAIGYGVARKSDLTGSVGSISSESIAERPALNIEQSLAGRIAGVNVQTNSGRPGGRTSVSIRGFSSINASNDPLYVVDGIIWTIGINDLNPNDIESIDVLKDASATAIYGTRGSNGVILITTKRGEIGSQIIYDNYISINWLPQDRKLGVLNASEFLFIEDEQYRNAPKFDPVGFENGRYTDPVEKRMDYLVGNEHGNRELFTLNENGIPQPLYDVDWQDMVTRTAIGHNHNLSYTGGDAFTNYGIFMGYANEEGIIKESYAKRYSVRAVIDRQMRDWLKVGGNISYSRTSDSRVDESVGSNNALRLMVEMIPIVPYKYDDGAYGYRHDYAGMETGDNPLAQLEELKILYNSNSFNGNTYATIKIFDGFEFTSTLGITNSNQVNQRFKGILSVMSPRGMNDAQISSNESKFWQWSNRINYNRQINDIHDVSLLLGSEIQKLDYLSWTARTQNMPDDYYMWNNLSAGANPVAPGSSAYGYQMESYFGRVNYGISNKYLITLTGRYDGSSRFGTANKFAFFPSSAIAWRVSEEDFLQDNNIISNLKFRASYGVTGNSDIGSYRSQANLSTNSYVFNGTRVSGSSIGRLANPELQWEKAVQYNVGFDFGILENRISLETDFYIKETSNLLFDAPVPSTSGYTIVTRNIGSMENKGVEIALNTMNVRNNNFSWTTTFNFSYLNNKITALGENDEDIIYGVRDGLILRVGESVGSFYGYIRDGIWSTDEEAQAAEFGKKPGDLRIKDLNNDKTINSEDRAIMGKGIPDLYGTFSNSFRFRNFDLVLDIQYSYGNNILMNSRSTGEARQGRANSYSTVLDAWTPDNQDAILEQVRPQSAGYGYFVDTRRVEDGSFIRGKNLLLGYNLPMAANSLLGINRMRIFASVQNFFLITDYFGYDPEVTTYDSDPFAQGVLFYDYPKPRTLMFGVNVNF